MKTLDQIKDDVAFDHEWEDWQNIENSDLEPCEIDKWHANLLDEVAKRYAKAKLEEAAERAEVNILNNSSGYDKSDSRYTNEKVTVTVDGQSITETPLD